MDSEAKVATERSVAGRSTLTREQYLELHPHEPEELGDESSSIPIVKFEAILEERRRNELAEHVIHDLVIIDMQGSTSSEIEQISTVHYEPSGLIPVGVEEMAKDSFATPPPSGRVE